MAISLNSVLILPVPPINNTFIYQITFFQTEDFERIKKKFNTQISGHKFFKQPLPTRSVLKLFIELRTIWLNLLLKTFKLFTKPRYDLKYNNNQ